SAGDVHIGFPAGEEQVSAFVEVADVAGVEEPSGKGFGVGIGAAEVAGAHSRSGHADFALLTGGQLRSAFVDDDDLDSGAGTTAGADSGVVDGDSPVVFGAEDRNRSGHLGESEVLDEAGSEPVE